MIYIHSVPAISIFINVLISKIVFLYEHLSYLLIFSAIYSFVNFAATKIRRAPLYPFLPWDDWTSLIVCVVLNIPFIFIYYLVCYLARYFRPPPIKVE